MMITDRRIGQRRAWRPDGYGVSRMDFGRLFSRYLPDRRSAMDNAPQPEKENAMTQVRAIVTYEYECSYDANRRDEMLELFKRHLAAGESDGTGVAVSSISLEPIVPGAPTMVDDLNDAWTLLAESEAVIDRMQIDLDEADDSFDEANADIDRLNDAMFKIILLLGSRGKGKQSKRDAFEIAWEAITYQTEAARADREGASVLDDAAAVEGAEGEKKAA